VAFHDRERDAVAIGDAGGREGADAVARCEDAGEVQRIGSADDDDAAVGRRAADLAQALDGVGERELLARHAGDEAAAADLAARLEAAVDARQLAPRREVRLAREQTAEDDAVAAEEHPRLLLDCRLAWLQQRPTAAAAEETVAGDEGGAGELFERFRIEIAS